MQGNAFVEQKGVRIPLGPAAVTPEVVEALRANRYEGRKFEFLRRVLTPGDRVLILGGGIGFLAAACLRIEPAARVTLVEGDPARLAAIRATLAANGTAADLREGLPTLEGPGAGVVDLIALVEEVAPQILVCDLGGGELGLFDRLDLSSVRAAIVESSPRVIGEAGVRAVQGALAAQGLALPADRDPARRVQLYQRDPDQPPQTSALPPRPFRRWPMPDPRVWIATCMKDEGPFILEWVAWHRAMGVTDITVFTNDCSDGTDLLLDRLEEMGHLRHLPNPAIVAGSPAFQPMALAYAHHLPEARRADVFLSMDVDEFLNVRVGDGTLAALFAALPAFDAVSVTEVNHGSNRREGYERGWLTDLFPAHQTTTPGPKKARRGVKTIVRLSPKVAKLRNHRCDFRTDRGPVLWLDGSGRQTAHFLADAGENGHDCRGTYDLVRLEHFALRALDSYLAKMNRGDVVVKGKSVSQTYWRLRNRQDEASAGWEGAKARARGWFDRHLAGDAVLMARHEACCAAHAARIAELLKDPHYAGRKAWALAEAW